MNQKTKPVRKPKSGTRSRDAAEAGETGRGPGYRPSAQEISEEVITLIERQVFVPGEPLRERDLAARFDVTRGRIREALHILEARGFVTMERMKGATIARHDNEEIIANGEVRSALMALAAKRAAERATKAEREAILKLTHDLAVNGPTLPPQEYRQATIRIGGVICKAARSPYIERLINDAHRGRAYRVLSVASRARRVQSSRNWLRIAEAIDKGDTGQAAKAVNKLYDQALAAIKEAIAAE